MITLPQRSVPGSFRPSGAGTSEPCIFYEASCTRERYAKSPVLKAYTDNSRLSFTRVSSRLWHRNNGCRQALPCSKLGRSAEQSSRNIADY